MTEFPRQETITWNNGLPRTLVVTEETTPASTIVRLKLTTKNMDDKLNTIHIEGITFDDFSLRMQNWIQGRMLAQNAFPHLTPDEREFIMTGSTQEDWDKMFPPEDEMEYDPDGEVV